MFYISLQEEILDILSRAENQEMDFEDELLKELKIRHPDKLTFDLRSAMLPLMSSGRVELDEGRIRLPITNAEAH